MSHRGVQTVNAAKETNKSRVKRVAISLTISAAVVTSLQAVGFANPASAACTDQDMATYTYREGSEPFNAGIGCNGVWALRARTQSDYIRGVYNKDGAWEQSTYGWVWVSSLGSSNKIIGDTVAGRRVKGITQSYQQYVTYRF